MWVRWHPVSFPPRCEEERMGMGERESDPTLLNPLDGGDTGSLELCDVLRADALLLELVDVDEERF